MTMATDPPSIKSREWFMPDPTIYDRSPHLSEAEYHALDVFIHRLNAGTTSWPPDTRPAIQRLLMPLHDILQRTQASKRAYHNTIIVFLREMHQRRSSLWAWTTQEWLEVLDTSGQAFESRYKGRLECRQHILAVGYLLCNFTDFHLLGRIDKYPLACKIFEQHLVDHAIQRLREALLSLSYKMSHRDDEFPGIVCVILLNNKSPYLEDLTLDTLHAIRRGAFAKFLTGQILAVSRALRQMGIIHQVLPNAIQEGERFGNIDGLKTFLQCGSPGVNAGERRLSVPLNVVSTFTTTF